VVHLIRTADPGLVLQKGRSIETLRSREVTPNLSYRQMVPIPARGLGTIKADLVKGIAIPDPHHQEKMWVPQQSLMRIARFDAVNSSGRDKLLEILSDREFTTRPNQLFITLAEGPGSMASLLLHWSKESIVLYNSLLNRETMAPTMIGNFVPPEACCSCIIPSQIIGQPEADLFAGDLRYEQTWIGIDQTLRTKDALCELLVMDLPDHGPMFEEIWNHLLTFLTRNTVRNLCIKMFLWTLTPKWRKKFLVITNGRENIHLYKPATGNLFNEEFYLWVGPTTAPGKSSPYNLPQVWQETQVEAFLQDVSRAREADTELSRWVRVFRVIRWKQTFSYCLMRDPCGLRESLEKMTAAESLLRVIRSELAQTFLSLTVPGKRMQKGESYTHLGDTEAKRAGHRRLIAMWKAYWVFRTAVGGLFTTKKFDIGDMDSREFISAFNRAHQSILARYDNQQEEDTANRCIGQMLSLDTAPASQLEVWLLLDIIHLVEVLPEQFAPKECLTQIGNLDVKTHLFQRFPVGDMLLQSLTDAFIWETINKTLEIVAKWNRIHSVSVHAVGLWSLQYIMSADFETEIHQSAIPDIVLHYVNRETTVRNILTEPQFDLFFHPTGEFHGERGVWLIARFSDPGADHLRQASLIRRERFTNTKSDHRAPGQRKKY